MVVSKLLYGCTTRMLKNVSRESITGTAQECNELYWTNLGSNTPRNNSCTATYLISLKPSKKDERETQKLLENLGQND